MKNQFAVSQIVTLKSGGPQLKIISLQAGKATVEWSDGENVRTETLPLTSLKIA